MKFVLSPLVRRLGTSLLAAALIAGPVHAQRSAPRTADYILAVVNQELVTAGEVQQRVDRIAEDARRRNQQLPRDDELRREVLKQLIDERVLVTHARDTGTRVDEAELDRAIGNVAAQNQLTQPQLRERLRSEGVDYQRFRNNIRDQIMVERVRERDVQSRIQISDADIDTYLKRERGAEGQAIQYNIAQVLVTVPEGASDAVVAQRRALVEAAQARVRGGEAFDAVARAVSEDSNKGSGGEIGLRPASRLPDLFVNAVRTLQPGEVAPAIVRSGAGFHLLKLIDRQEAGAMVTQTRARHILLRTSPELTPEVATRRLQTMKRQIESGARTFEQLARDNSQDGSAAQGGELGWVSPGNLVPEFEQAMNALPINGVSEPVVSRFGVHLIQVTERREVALDPKQLREQARNELREQKFESVYEEWLRDLRNRAYIEMREPPQ
jgi:peptidyl-prolyl cis-trans isomerase SurA